MITYLSQLETLATETGWKLKEACIDAGVADTTYYRWVNGTSSPRLKEAKKVALYMQTYGH